MEQEHPQRRLGREVNEELFRYGRKILRSTGSPNVTHYVTRLGYQDPILHTENQPTTRHTLSTDTESVRYSGVYHHDRLYETRPFRLGKGFIDVDTSVW